MPRLRPIPLKENPDAAPAHASIIDAEFTIVHGRRKSFFGRVKWWLTAIAIAALVGFLVPPITMLAKALL